MNKMWICQTLDCIKLAIIGNDTSSVCADAATSIARYCTLNPIRVLRDLGEEAFPSSCSTTTRVADCCADQSVRPALQQWSPKVSSTLCSCEGAANPARLTTVLNKCNFFFPQLLIQIS